MTGFPIISAGISNEKFRLMDSYMALDTKQYLVDLYESWR
jgi:hypothetical protein